MRDVPLIIIKILKTCRGIGVKHKIKTLNNNIGGQLGPPKAELSFNRQNKLVNFDLFNLFRSMKIFHC